MSIRSRQQERQAQPPEAVQVPDPNVDEHVMEPLAVEAVAEVVPAETEEDLDDEKSLSHRHHSLLGIALIMLGCFCASVMFLFVKLLADNVSTFTLVFYRALVQVVFSLVPLIRQPGTNPLGPPRIRWLLVLRAGFGAAAVLAWFYGAQVLPLPDAVTLQFTSPPFAAFFAVFVVGEPWERLDRVGAVVCIAGVALIAHPTWLFGSTPSDDGAATTSSLAMQALATLVMTVGSALAGLAYVCVRKIGHEASALVMVLYFGAMSIPVAVFGSVVFAGGNWNVVTVPFSVRNYSLILLVGILGHGGQWLLNLGLQYETAATATLATCTQIVWTYIFELTFLHEPLDKFSVAGSLLILGYMLVVAVLKLQESSPPPSSSAMDKNEEEEPSEGTRLLKDNRTEQP